MKSSKSNDIIITDKDKKLTARASKNNTGTSIEKEDLICKIIKYQTNMRFGPIISKELGFKYTRPQLSKQSIDSLETILHRIRTHLNTRNMDAVFSHMVKTTAKGYEDVVTGFGYNIEGFSELLLQNPAFHDAFERWKIEQKIPDVPPSMQLMYIIASTTYIAHMNNRHIQARIAQEAPVETIKKEIKKDIIIKDKDEKEIVERHKTNYKVGEII